ncbi:uncharacterized protein LOC124280408 isoform X2 [Haliotis rubra]|uniref:uncharacterized protein LOC124280408 isoform X2 n=1 Tax=Haliotis rubra TaxID=36100 RepID=UPI001EE5C887|nr:uncharacterized protein LOC124280408 isoform X2 [Haliotis rubra]
MDGLLEERFRCIDTEISNQNRYLQQQFEKQKRQNDDIRQVVSQIEKSLGTPATEDLIKLTAEATDGTDRDKRTVDESVCLESADKQNPLTDAGETHKNTEFKMKTLSYSKHQETSWITSPESPISTASEGKAQLGMHERDVTSSQSYGKKDSKPMLTTMGTKPAHIENKESEVFGEKEPVVGHESETVHNRKGHSNEQIKNIPNEQITATIQGSLPKAREVSSRKEELKSSATNIWGVKKNKPDRWNSVDPTTHSNNTFTNSMEQFGAVSQFEDYGTDYIETCTSPSCTKISDLSSVTVFSNNDDQSDYDVDMYLSYPSGMGNARLEYTYLVNQLLCSHNCHVLNVRETRYTLTSPNGLQKKWSRIDKYRPGQKPPDFMKDLPFALVPLTRPMSVGAKQLPTRSPHELKELVQRSKVVVSKDDSIGSPEGHLMHTLYQMKEIVGEDADLWKPVEEALKKEVTPVARCDIGVDTILCLDNSGTMPRQAYIQMKKLAIDFINGIEDVAEMHDLEENIGVVTLGSRATVLHHLSNDYGSLREILDQLECGGVPTDHCIQLQGLLVCLAAMTKGGVCNFGGRTTVPPRLILITDGLTIGKVDQVDKSHKVELFYTALDHMGAAFVRNNVVGPIQVVPYGEAKQKRSTQILDFMIKGKDGKEAEMLDVDTVVAAVCSGYSHQERKQISKIVRDRLNEVDRWLGLTDEFDNVSIKAGLPDLGTRVVRGPDWRWGDQDDGGAGTVINHGEDGESLWLSWDNGFTNVYRYGVSGNYDALIVDDQPRMVNQEGAIDIGMQVERGPNWPDTSGQNDSLGLYGTVIRKRNGRVLVIWNNSTIRVHSFGEGGKYEVATRDPLKCIREHMPRVDTDKDHWQVGAEESASKHPKDEPAADEVGDSSVWQWLGKDNQWRSYSESNNKKLRASYKKRPGGSCLIQRDGTSFRVIFKSFVEKSIEDGSTTDVRKLDVEVSQMSERVL